MYFRHCCSHLNSSRAAASELSHRRAGSWAGLATDSRNVCSRRAWPAAKPALVGGCGRLRRTAHPHASLRDAHGTWLVSHALQDSRCT